MLARLAYRVATELSPRLAAKAAYLWVYKGAKAVWAYQRRMKRDELYPPFRLTPSCTRAGFACCWAFASRRSRHSAAMRRTSST